jgi:kynurenine formamidase
MRVLTLLLSFAIVATITVAQKRPAGFPAGAIVDLTYEFDSETVYWPTAESFHLEKDFVGNTEKGFFYSAYRYSAAEHGGTHIDAPVHFAEGHQSVDQIPLDQLIGPGIVVDVTKQSAANPDYLVTTEDLLAWERINGKIASGTIVLLRTGFGKFYPDRKKYMGTLSAGRRPSPSFTFLAYILTPLVGL